MKERHIGIAQVIASGVCAGFLGIFGKYLFENNVKPGELLALRFSCASLLGFLLLFLRSRGRFQLSWRQVFACMLLGILGYALLSFCFFTALSGLSASLTVLLLYTYPIFVAFGAWIFFQEKISRSHLLAFPVAACGIVGLVWGDFSVDHSEALLFGLGSSIFYALYILASSRLLRKVDPFVSTPTIQFFAGLVLASLYLRDIDHSLQLTFDSGPGLRLHSDGDDAFSGGSAKA
jgi:drug/metabolite transporter (DMT)-like permease